jgi:long-subunit acyl-CoA synthetase (AMP-forming)
LERSAFWDRIVFSKVAGAFGGELKIISSGAAPISGKVPKFLMV